MPIGAISPLELKARLAAKSDLVLVDVREPWENATAKIEGAKLIPLNVLPQRLSELPKDAELVFHCHHGMRSLRACQFAEQQGYTKLLNLSGGIDAWSTDADPRVPRY